MANTQAQFGFQHIGYLPGGAVDMQLSKYSIQSSYATAIYFGDPVCKSAALGPYVIPATASTGGTSILGIFYGAQCTPKGGSPVWSPWYPGVAQAADSVAYVMDAPNALFRVAALLTAVPATAIGNNIGFSTGAGGTTVGAGLSTYTVDQASIGVSNILGQFQIVKMYSDIGIGNGSDNSSNYNWVVVTFNQQRYRAPATGVA